MTKTERSRLLLEPGGECVRAAREAVAEPCHGLARDIVYNAELLTSELVTNAMTHGTGAIRLEVTRSPGHLRITVDDDDPHPPCRVTAEPDDTGGRGLMIVDALSDRWGVNSRGGGKQVWLELRTA